MAVLEFEQHLTNINISSREMMMNSTQTIELYTVLISITIVVPFSILAVFTNIALLMSTRCKRSICRLQYGLAYCLATSNVLFCAIWAPLDVVRIIMEYMNIGMHSVACHLDIALQYFCITVIVLIHVFLVVQHAHTISKPKDQGRDTIVVIGLISCPVVAVGVAVVVTFQYKESLGRLACLGVSAVGLQHPDFYPVPVGMVIVNCIWFLLLLIASAELIITLVKQKFKLVAIDECDRSSRQSKKYSIHECSNMDPSRAETSLEHDKSVSECQSSKSRDASSPNTHRTTFQQFSLPYFGRKDSKDLRTKETNDESDIDDDEFDQKMKLQLQKSLSGRRHTVANIGLGDSPFASSSKDRMSKKNNPDPSFNYQYVRKWSVDIQALQDQLQNPKKAQTVENPFRSLSRLQGNEESKSTKEIEKKKTEEKVMFKDEEEIITSPTKETPDHSIIEEEEEEDETHDVESEEEEENDDEGEEQEEDNKADNDEENDADPKTDKTEADTEIKTGNGGHQAHDDDKESTIDHEEEASQGLLSVDSITAPFNSVSVIQNAKQGKETMEKEDEKKQLILQDEQRQEIGGHLQTTSVCLLLVLLVVISTLPFIILQILAGTSIMPLSLNRNMSTILGIACVLQCTVQPILIAWMQNKIWQALKKLRAKIAQLKCVCYCNIGKRQQCVGRNVTA